MSNVKDPGHYDGDGKVKCKRAMRSMVSRAKFLEPIVIYWWLTAFKYLWRWPFKNGFADIDKCIQSLEYMKEEHKRSCIERHNSPE